MPGQMSGGARHALVQGQQHTEFIPHVWAFKKQTAKTTTL